MTLRETNLHAGITFFTNLIYTAIKYTVSNGDVAPFVGHNAILRWSAIQEIGYYDEDGYEKFWSEAHVSEDFEMSLKYVKAHMHPRSCEVRGTNRGE